MWSELRVISMNVNGPRDGNPEAPGRRRKVISDVVLGHRPHIMLYQEFQWVGITGNTWNDAPIPGYYESSCTRYSEKSAQRTGIMYDSRRLSAQDLQTTAADIFTRLHANRKFLSDFDGPLSRMKIMRFTIEPAGPDSTFICVSWHGPNRGWTDERKCLYLLNFLRFMGFIQAELGNPMLIGGDFNVDISAAEQCVLENSFRVHRYIPPARRVGGHILDYFITSGNMALSPRTSSCIDLQTFYGTYNPAVIPNNGTEMVNGTINAAGILDHDPIVCGIMIFLRPFQSSSQTQTSVESFWRLINPFYNNWRWPCINRWVCEQYQNAYVSEQWAFRWSITWPAYMGPPNAKHNQFVDVDQEGLFLGNTCYSFLFNNTIIKKVGSLCLGPLLFM